MNLLVNKFKEVVQSVLPIVVIVLILSLFVVDVSGDMLARFFIGSIFVIFGLTIFLFGIDIGMEPIADILGKSFVDMNSKWYVAIMGFLLGFSITIAEPNLLVMAEQISDATGGFLGTQLVLVVVSIGVGIMIALGAFRILTNFPLSRFYTILYGIILILSFFVSAEFLAMAFDASGSSTGALTVPVVLALGGAIAMRAGGSHAEENSFGLVGTMATGPIIAVLILAIFTDGEIGDGGSGAYTYTEGIFAPFFGNIWQTLVDSVISLVPIVLIFVVMNLWKFKIPKDDLADIFKGLVYTLVGLTLFLVGVNQGFMDMGRFLGEEIATNMSWFLPIIGLIMGMVIVLAEPAVHTLGDQVEEVTGGFISNKLLLTALSIGVGLGVGLSMLRIMIPGFELWHIFLPGYVIAILLGYYNDELFTGISFDAGAVASGPMTATFITAFGQGAAAMLDQATIFDGFGVIATVAMVPIVMVQLLGLLYKRQMSKLDSQ